MEIGLSFFYLHPADERLYLRYSTGFFSLFREDELVFLILTSQSPKDRTLERAIR